MEIAFLSVETNTFHESIVHFYSKSLTIFSTQGGETQSRKPNNAYSKTSFLLKFRFVAT